jgi:hypothetical protein
LPRCSCPYAGTTRIRFEGLPRPTYSSSSSGRRRLSPLSGHPLDWAIIRKVSPMRQGGGLMTEKAAPPAARKRADLLVYPAVEAQRGLSKISSNPIRKAWRTTF